MRLSAAATILLLASCVESNIESSAPAPQSENTPVAAEATDPAPNPSTDPTPSPTATPTPDPTPTPMPDPTPTPSKPVLPPACDALSARDSAVAMYALPDAGEAPFQAALAKAKSHIEVMVYLMGRGAILDALKAAPANHVTTRVILDQSQASANQKYFDELKNAGAEVHWSDTGFTYMHAKVLVVDGETAVITTGNYSKQFSIDVERNFVAVLEDEQDLEDLTEIFEADWAKRTPALDCTRLLVSPVNSKDRLLAHIASATTTLDIESMQFADWSVRYAVKDAKNRGVAVRVLLADPSWIDANTSAATWLKGIGVEARWMKTPHVHTKAITVDGTKSYVGSINLSSTSLTKNREVGIITDDAAAVFVVENTFNTDWPTATAF